MSNEAGDRRIGARALRNRSPLVCGLGSPGGAGERERDWSHEYARGAVSREMVNTALWCVVSSHYRPVALRLFA